MTSSPSQNTIPLESSQVDTKRRAFLRQASAPSLTQEKPTLIYRWLHAQESAKSWLAFGPKDSRALEAAWQQHKDDLGDPSGNNDQESGPNSLEATVDAATAKFRVPVLEDRLYDVDLRTRKLISVFWKSKPANVSRGTWFFDSGKIVPCSEATAQELEELYDSIQPWLPSYRDELRSSVSIGSDAEDKLKAPLHTLKGSYVIFLGPHLARIYADDVPSRITKTIWTAWSGAHGGGTLVARGFDNAQSLLKTREAAGKSSPKAKAPAKNHSHQQKHSVEGRSKDADDGSDDCRTPKGESSQHTTSENQSNKETEGTNEKKSGDFVRSWMAKFGPWSSAPTSASPNLSEKAQEDVRDAFKEAQERVQEADIEMQQNSTQNDITQKEDAHEHENMTYMQREDAEYAEEIQRDEKPVELILVWHGIGQKIAEEWKSFDFTLAVSSLRALIHTRMGLPAPADVGGKGFSDLGKDRRIQLLPVMWRATLEDFEPAAHEEGADPAEHLDNRFTIDDIFSDTIPVIKQLISGILFDIPMYLSQHRDEILKRVIKENNRIFGLFQQRNPKFLENGGRVNLIAHSLGAALAADILSRQPTVAQPQRHLSPSSSELNYDVHNLYFVGSPVALFMWINKAQLIARKGRELTKDSPIDEALDRAGRWGCFAVDRIFNIFSASDPIGTRLNSTVDAVLAKDLKSVSLSRTVKSILRTLPDTQAPASAPPAGLFSTWTNRNSANDVDAPDGTDIPDDAESLFPESNESHRDKKGFKPTDSLGRKWRDWKGKAEAKNTSTKIENEEKEDNGEVKQKGSKEYQASESTPSSEQNSEIALDRARRRMDALCELGCVDFVIPASASFLSNQYMEFLWSHASYWTDNSFADFVLATLLSSPERLREAKRKLSMEP